VYYRRKKKEKKKKNMFFSGFLTTALFEEYPVFRVNVTGG
jgi:hypothetical protein